ncbi:tetratricopeptide (TPR) repeat protein [Duganella sp. SG902]|uniref:tetratricopeptide repeat protein n=1 Tax=Duganella sp. SG902 TaxID=2587016 RepID=UPI00159DE0C4|nr:tetratricopeptide repeat protein [Duganella sp. SG902]NVM77705.1 tetratricopeptide (TPR) repeat protein [Duganella sp. SG902]
MNYALEIDRAIENEDPALALALAERWVAEAPETHAAWGNLAHVHEMRDDFAKASQAVSEALRITPDYPPYLFEQGYIAYRLGNYTQAERAFGLCVEQSEMTHDNFYLDAARIARARCLVLDGRASLAAKVIADAAGDAAAWLDGRFSKEDVLTSIRAATQGPS